METSQSYLYLFICLFQTKRSDNDIQTKVNDLKKNIADKTEKSARGCIFDFLIDVKRYFESEEKVFTGKKNIEIKRIIATLQCKLNSSLTMKFKTNVLMEEVETFMKELTEIRKLKTLH